MGDVGGGPPADGLSTSERAELERLRVEVGQLQAKTHGRAARAGRSTASTVIVIVAALLFGVSVVAGYLRTQLLNTDRYVATVAPPLVAVVLLGLAVLVAPNRRRGLLLGATVRSARPARRQRTARRGRARAGPHRCPTRPGAPGAY